MALSGNPFQILWSKLPAPLQNRFYLTLTAFFFLLIFLDKHNLWTQWRLYRAQKRLEADKAYYEQKIREARDEAEDFELTKEKFAREHYYMKRANEDVYIIKRK
jgi:cell division protein DivIC